MTKEELCDLFKEYRKNNSYHLQSFLQHHNIPYAELYHKYSARKICCIKLGGEIYDVSVRSDLDFYPVEVDWLLNRIEEEIEERKEDLLQLKSIL